MDKIKLDCFVDETGPDTKGVLFIVSVIMVAREEKNDLLSFCELCVRECGKRGYKWGKARYSARVDYLRHIFADSRLKGKVIYSVFRGEEDKDYDSKTIFAIKEAIKRQEFVQGEGCTSTVYVDALVSEKHHKYRKVLRGYGVDIQEVRGVKKDENNSLIRLADSVAGFVRDMVFDGDEGDLKDLFTRVSRSGALVEAYSADGDIPRLNRVNEVGLNTLV